MNYLKTRMARLPAASLFAVLCATCCAHASDALSIRFPLERHVQQRDEQDQANVTVSGTIQSGVEIVEAKADLSPGAKRGQAVDWTVIARGDELVEGEFTGRLSLTAGGWYLVTVRARRGKDVIAESQATKVGVGDVFVTAGQSNSANYGKPRQAAQDDRVVFFNGKSFVPAADPIPGGSGGGGSPWPILGDRIAQSQQVPVCFRSATLTWTEVKNWLPPDTRLYKNLVSCVGEFGTSGVRAVLWHQGESDSLAKTSAETYCERLNTIIKSLNKDARYQVPWFVAQASFHPGSKKPQEEEVANGQRLLWKRGFAHAGAITDDLGQEYRSDGVHFNQRGLTTHAERWFAALAATYKWNADPSEKRK